MLRMDEVPRHGRQKEFEYIFCLGPRELLLKTYSASHQQSLGKLWISTSAVSFSSGPLKRIVVRLCDVRDVRSSGFRSIVFVLVDDTVHEFSSLWHKDECFTHISALWWNGSRPARAQGPPRATTELDDMVLIGSGGHEHMPEREKSQSPVSGVVGKALDDLDEVADLLLLPAADKTVAPRCDQYGFPLDQFEPRVEAKYNEFIGAYVKDQEKMRRRWLKFMHRHAGEDSIANPENREALLTLLLRGLPPELRPSIYFRISGARKKRSEAEPGYYALLREEAAKHAADTEWGRAIEKDLLRTYPYHVDFNEEQGALIPTLRNVLLAYGLRNSVVGYCFADHHELLTNEGFLGIDELEARWDASRGVFSNGLRIGAPNGSSGRLDFQLASHFILNPVGSDAFVYEFVGSDGEAVLRVTGEHEMYVQWSGGAPCEKVSASRLFEMGQKDPSAVCRILMHAPEGVSNAVVSWEHFGFASRDELKRFLVAYGMWLAGVGDGVVAEWVWQLDAESLRHIVEGLCHAGNVVVVACSEFGDALVRIATLAGYGAEMTLAGGVWRVRILSDNVWAVRLGSMRRVPYSGRSFCVTVPNGLVMARRVEHSTIGGQRVLTRAWPAAVTGNCQSMNFVCAALLLIFRDIRNDLDKEEKVFWVLCAIVEDLLPGYYSADMIGSMVDQSVLAHFCEKRMPRLYAQFTALEYPISLVLCKWMNCLFWVSTPAETAARIMDVTMMLGSDALLEFSLGFLASFQSVLCQCEDLNEISKLLDSSMVAFFPTPGNVERMQSCIGQLDRRELLTMRHRVSERAEIRLREYSTARTLDRLRNLGSMDEKELRAMQAHWAQMFASAPHKDGVDREIFCQAVGRSILPEWQREPRLLAQLFEHVNKSHSGVVSLNEWANMVESLASNKAKLRLLYGVCGDKGDPVKVAATLGMLCRCWRGVEASKEELAIVENAESVYTPEKFVRMLKAKYPDLLTVLKGVKFKVV
jgi:hypothetical protein